MNPDLQIIVDILQKTESISEELKASIYEAVKKVENELVITNFKLDRTEKVKRTTAILLEETIDELEQKRKAVEDSNAALKESMEELKATQAQLIHAEKMASLGELTAGIAHEIQNPLNFVNNFSEVNTELIGELKEELEKGDIEEVKVIANDIANNEEKIKHHGKRADAIVKGMLQHSRSSTGEKELTDINLLADEYLRLAFHGYRAKEKSFNAAFKTEFDDLLPKIYVIPQEIGRVLLNLINNAFQAVYEKSKSGIGDYSPIVIVRTKMLTNKIEINVKDNGPGIPADVKDKIFQPFFTTKPAGEGTGLGLSLSYDIITKGHGGELTLVTKEGAGSKFTISLPLQKINSAYEKS